MDAHNTKKRIPVQLDISSKLLSAGTAVRALPNVEPETILASYLALIYDLRAHNSGGEVSLRRDDILSLAESMESTEDEIINKLTRLMNCSAGESRRFKRMLKKGKVFIPIGMVAAGAVLVATFTINTSAPSNSYSQNQKATIVNESTSHVVLASEVNKQSSSSTEVSSKVVENDNSSIDTEIGSAVVVENTDLNSSN